MKGKSEMENQIYACMYMHKCTCLNVLCLNVYV